MSADDAALLVFGQSGQVAQELAHLAPQARFLSRAMADLSDPAACAAAIRAHAPRAVINAAAWTAVDRAEAEEPAAQQVNAAAPGAMARVCAEMAIPFVTISSDYVFSGAGQTPWRPDDACAPLGAYGRSKWAGEQAVQAAGGAFVILRSSWVFSAHGANFVKTMLRLGASRDRLDVVADQIGGPTPAAAIAQACLTMAAALARDPGLSGIYHLSGAPDLSWADFARAIFERAGLAVQVSDIASAAYPTAAARPANSRLECSDLARFGVERPDWRAGLDKVLQQLGARP